MRAEAVIWLDGTSWDENGKDLSYPNFQHLELEGVTIAEAKAEAYLLTGWSMSNLQIIGNGFSIVY